MKLVKILWKKDKVEVKYIERMESIGILGALVICSLGSWLLVICSLRSRSLVIVRWAHGHWSLFATLTVIGHFFAALVLLWCFYEHALVGRAGIPPSY